MVWLRIDYNGHGFDAFVTDVNLGRTRVSYTHAQFPQARTSGCTSRSPGTRPPASASTSTASSPATKAATGLFDAALDQFGPHSRIIGPTGVESSYNYDRGGDIDELRIYDRMLSDDNIASLAKRSRRRNRIPAVLPVASPTPDVAEGVVVPLWLEPPRRYPCLRLPDGHTIVRKVEIHDAYDLKRWWWKGTDGIRETTWPGVYNRSRLVGRVDYFQLPDWDCYSLSGKSVTFYMPDEPWNHLEIERRRVGQCFAANAWRRRSRSGRRS